MISSSFTPNSCASAIDASAFNTLCFIFNLSIHNVYDCTINYYFTDNKKKLSLDKDYFNDYISNCIYKI